MHIALIKGGVVDTVVVVDDVNAFMTSAHEYVGLFDSALIDQSEMASAGWTYSEGVFSPPVTP